MSQLRVLGVQTVTPAIVIWSGSLLVGVVAIVCGAALFRGKGWPRFAAPALAVAAAFGPGTTFFLPTIAVLLACAVLLWTGSARAYFLQRAGFGPSGTGLVP